MSLYRIAEFAQDWIEKLAGDDAAAALADWLKFRANGTTSKFAAAVQVCTSATPSNSAKGLTVHHLTALPACQPSLTISQSAY